MSFWLSAYGGNSLALGELLSSLQRGTQIQMHDNKFHPVKGKEVNITEQSLCTGYLSVRCWVNFLN